MRDSSLEINEGDLWPGWNGPFEGSVLTVSAQGLMLLVSMPLPREKDLADFRNLTAVGVFEKDFPLVIWCFGQNFLLPTPFNPEFERQHNAKALASFLSAGAFQLQRTLINERGLVCVLVQSDLQKEFVECVQRGWQPAACDWHRYNPWLHHTFQTPTHLLWAEATIFHL
jgi:hypothetical protein